MSEMENIAVANDPAAPQPSSVSEQLDSRSLRDAFALFPTGVAVVTAYAQSGDRLGITINSFSSVSLQPALILWSLGRSTRSYSLWASVKSFAVNVLARDQHDIADQFARKGSDRWRHIAAVPAERINAPVLPRSLVRFECQTYARHEAGDHLIFLGAVKFLSLQAGSDDDALLFHRSRYREIARTDL